MKKMKQQRTERKKPRNEATRMPLPNLPTEIKDKIFLNIPMRYLLDFRCVIKDYSRFENPHFIKMHLNRLMEIDNGSTCIITTASKIYKVDFSVLPPISRAYPFASPTIPIKLDFPFQNPTCSSPLKVVGSCNGLVCLSHRGFYGRIMYLWNPATDEYKQLPPHNLSEDGIHYLGFGYDHLSGQFKVLAFSEPVKPKIGLHKVEAAIYTLGTGSWRSIGEIQYSFWQSKMPQVFEGCPHWIVRRLETVVWFSIGDEEFKEIPLPPIQCDTRTDLTALGGRLAIFSHVSELKCFELWVRINDGLKNTWAKQLSFRDLDVTGFGYIKPLGFKNGHVLLQGSLSGPIFFDPVNNAIRPVYIRGVPKDFLVYPYIESLAMLSIEDRGVVHQNS